MAEKGHFLFWLIQKIAANHWQYNQSVFCHNKRFVTFIFHYQALESCSYIAMFESGVVFNG